MGTGGRSTGTYGGFWGRLPSGLGGSTRGLGGSPGGLGGAPVGVTLRGGTFASLVAFESGSSRVYNVPNKEIHHKGFSVPAPGFRVITREITP